ncbi:MAG: cytochrome C oxidase subunit IV family protein [Planctomycetia bacterium]|nr:cytochrome C oxidase subunit IV family protein [Planctomycetia bacterium]
MSSITDPTPLHTHEDTTHHEGDGEHCPHGLGHISPWQTLVKVWAALMALTILTVMATWVNLGSLNIWIAMAIAVVKGALVVLYFMHMKYDRPFIAYIFTFSLAFVAFFLGMVMLDSKSYQPAVEIRRLDEIQVTAAPVSTPAAPAPVK